MVFRMTKKIDPLQRLTHLELLLKWEGYLNSTRLRELFGLSAVRASEWIRELRGLQPAWMEWDSKTRSYYATSEVYRQGKDSDARKLESAESLARYLALVGLPHATQPLSSDRVVWAAFPDLSVPSPRVFAILTEASRNHRAVEITYRSMREPMPHQRIISPHSLIRAGRRWHARAFCATNKQFRDYALGRIVDVKFLEQPAERLETDDEAWMTRVPVRIIAHPDLTPAQEALIRFEYFNDTASRVETCRGSLVNYFIQDLRAAIDVKTQRPPEYQLAVGNIKEIKPWLFPV